MRSPTTLKTLLPIIVLAVCQETAFPLQVEARAPSATELTEVARPASGLPPSLAPMLAKIFPSVVSVGAEGTTPAPQNEVFKDPVLRRLLGLPELPSADKRSTGRFESAGSGVIIDARRGYVVTVNHVIEHADQIRITLADGRQLDATLVGADPETDVAVLKIDPDGLVSLPFGDSNQLQIGDYVVALGNPFGVGETATFGIVSGLGRMGFGVESYEDFIQTDASINPGDSGGALVDSTGHLIGINAALLSHNGTNVGIGFAIPIDAVKLVAEQLITTGKVSRGDLGLVVQDLTPSGAKEMQIQMASGAVVSQVNPDSAAAKAGIENGDVVVELDGKTITTGGQFRNVLELKQPGEVVKLKILHRGNERNVVAMLEPTPP